MMMMMGGCPWLGDAYGATEIHLEQCGSVPSLIMMFPEFFHGIALPLLMYRSGAIFMNIDYFS